MTKVSWKIIEQNSLVLFDNSIGIILPTAEEVFLSEFKNKNYIQGLEVEKPSKQLPSLFFSKFPVQLKLVVKAVTDPENILFIDVNVAAVYKNIKKNLIGITDSDIDHMIIDNVWYPIEKGAVREVKTLLREVGIESLGRISIRQYLNIKKIKSSLIDDEVETIPINKGAIINNTNPQIHFFKGTLYPYQNQGYRWLKMIVNENAGCILADEMGLGKTAQVIAVLASESSHESKPSLVVAPVSLLENWRREVGKFAPDLRVLVHQGNERTGFYSEFLNYNLIITSYEVVLRDLSLFKMVQWNIVISDEAQAIKNPGAKRTLAIKQLERFSTIAVTGTPVENSILDLWSLTDFVLPGYLGSQQEFKEKFEDEVASAQELEPLVSPILLRRTVKEVANDLPQRIDVPQVIKLSREESELYDSLRIQIIEEYGNGASLVSLIKLRMFCTHPFLVVDSNENDPAFFGKYLRLVEILEEIILNGEKTIIFTSYSAMVDILLNDLLKRFKIPCDFIDGRVEVSERQIKIDRFSKFDSPAILLLNPRAAGAGLNITAANHVIHYNLEWNPAIEDQASARAYRRGQTRPVTIHRLFCAETVEEAINDRLERKRDISESVIVGNDGSKTDNTEILDALLKSPLN